MECVSFCCRDRGLGDVDAGALCLSWWRLCFSTRTRTSTRPHLRNPDRPLSLLTPSLTNNSFRSIPGCLRLRYAVTGSIWFRVMAMPRRGLVATYMPSIAVSDDIEERRNTLL